MSEENSVVRMSSIDPVIRKRMQQEAEWCVRGFFLSSVWNMLTPEQKEMAYQPVMTAMSQVVHACANVKDFVTYKTLEEYKKENNL